MSVHVGLFINLMIYIYACMVDTCSYFTLTVLKILRVKMQEPFWFYMVYVIANFVHEFFTHQAQKNGYQGATLGPKEADYNPRNFDEETIQAGMCSNVQNK